MIENGEAGIDCINCGHEEKAGNKKESEALSERLQWGGFGDPFCPECGHATTFEDYIDDA